MQFLKNVSALKYIEERECLEVYRNTYGEYMNRTPRWAGIPKSG
jgi:protein-S-isoprenylcysteine O-methyltransferase Ste14